MHDTVVSIFEGDVRPVSDKRGQYKDQSNNYRLAGYSGNI
jgi:hypothetical protein